MWQHEEVPQRTVLDADFADELWDEMADFYARETDGLGVTEGEKNTIRNGSAGTRCSRDGLIVESFYDRARAKRYEAGHDEF
jgi:hypothetical protein